jgi:hypothetical protein
MSFRDNIQRPSIDTFSTPAAQHPSHVRSSSSLAFAVPATTISDELQELRSLAELTKARVSNLEALLESPALAHITKTKRLMRDVHRKFMFRSPKASRLWEM